MSVFLAEISAKYWISTESETISGTDYRLAKILAKSPKYRRKKSTKNRRFFESFFFFFNLSTFKLFIFNTSFILNLIYLFIFYFKILLSLYS